MFKLYPVDSITQRHLPNTSQVIGHHHLYLLDTPTATFSDGVKSMANAAFSAHLFDVRFNAHNVGGTKIDFLKAKLLQISRLITREMSKQCVMGSDNVIEYAAQVRNCC